MKHIGAALIGALVGAAIAFLAMDYFAAQGTAPFIFKKPTKQ